MIYMIYVLYIYVCVCKKNTVLGSPDHGDEAMTWYSELTVTW